MNNTQFCKVEREGRLTVVTLNRPEVMNALHAEAHEELDAVFNAFEELFAPGRKHTRDEQKRLELTREDVGDADPGRGPIDLASGKVVVRRPKPEEPVELEEADVS